MTYLTTSKKNEILSAFKSTMPKSSFKYLLDEIASAIAADVLDGVTEGEMTSAIAAAISTLDLKSIENPGVAAVGVIRIENAVKDGETVTIGDDVYEFDTDDSVTGDNILVDLTGGSEVAAKGTLTVAVQPAADDTMTIGTTEYTFVGSSPGVEDIDIGADAAEAQANIVAAINGTDGINSAHPLVTIAAFAADDAVITAITPGTAGNSIDTTETFASGSNVFDAVELGTTTAGVDPTAAEASAALETEINTSATEDVVADKVDNNEVLIMASAVGAVTLALAETMSGADNTVSAAAMAGGAAIAEKKMVTGNFHVALDFAPSVVFVNVVATSGGAKKAWDGAITITSGDNPYVTIDNSGSTDWATTDTIYVLASQ